MTLPRDAKGGVLVTVSDLVDYLQTLKQDMPVILDNDGWMEGEGDYKTVHELIKNRGLFQVINFSSPFLIINN